MADENNNLPSSIQGDGRKFISLLKNYLGDIKDTIDEQYKYITGIFNANVDNPDTIAEQVHSLSIDEKRVSGSISLTLKWNSDNIKNYAGVLIEVKEKDGFAPVNWDDVEFTRNYTTAKTNTFTIENCTIGYQYYIRVRGRDIVNALSVASAAPIITHYVSPMDHTPRPPYEFTVVFDKRGAYWSWKQYDQNEYQWTELRLDTYAGEAHNRLDLTTDLYSIALPTARVGTAYLYNKGIGNAYSEPAKLDFALGVPPAPKHVTLTKEFGGLHITFDAIPDSCMGANVYINNEKHYVDTNEYLFLATMGTFTVKVAYVDALGEGALSQAQTITIVTYINKDWIRDGEITREKISSSVNKVMDDAVSSITQLNNDVTNINTGISNIGGDISEIISNLNSDPVNSSYNSIKKTADGLSALSKTVTTENSNIRKELSSAITTTNNSITTKVSELKTSMETKLGDLTKDVNAKYEANATSINQTANSLSSLATRVTQTERTNSTQATQIKQNADSITSTVTSLTKKINDNKAATDGAISGVSSRITQEAGRINTIITNLGKAPAETGYSAFTQTVNSINSVVKSVGDLKTATQSSITQLNDSIGLRVKKGETISDINLSPQGVYINGNHIMINGDTVINGKIIQGKNVADGTIQTLQIADGAIEAAKLSANAVTAAKIAANAITTDKIQAGAVQTKHMAANSIEGDRIKAGTLDAAKIKTGSITSNQIAVGTITGDKIAAGTITFDKMRGGTIDLESSGLGFTGGGVTLDSSGIALHGGNGSYTKLDTDGITWYDKSGKGYGTVRRMLKGEAYHDDTVVYNWDSPPFVMVAPTQFHETGGIPWGHEIYCRATNVTKDSFTIHATLTGPNTLRINDAIYTDGGGVGTKRTPTMYISAPKGATITLSYNTGCAVYLDNKRINPNDGVIGTGAIWATKSYRDT